MNQAQTTWYVYIIQTERGTFYTGITTSLERRLNEHKNSKRGAKFFSTSQAIKIVYSEKHPSRSEALKREAEIKKLKRIDKLNLINTSFSSSNKKPRSG